MSVQALKFPGQREKLRVFGVLFQFPQFRFGGKGFFQRCFGVLGDVFGDHIRFGDTDAQSPGHVFDHRLCLQGSKGDDLPYPLGAVFSRNVFDHVGAALVGKVNVKVGHGDPVRVEKTLKKEPVFEGINIRYAQ